MQGADLHGMVDYCVDSLWWSLFTDSPCILLLWLSSVLHCTVQDADLYGHGSHAPTYVPVFGSVLPTQMVSESAAQS